MTAPAKLEGGLRRFRRYPDYKDSGIEWFGKIPTHWEVRRLKTVASVRLSNVDKKTLDGQVPVRLCNYVDVYYNERIKSGMNFMAATATEDQIRNFALRKGDVLITKDSESWADIAVAAVVSEDLPTVLCGYHLALVRSGHECIGAFLARAFVAVGPRDQFQIASNGITRFGLGGDAITTGVFAVPPVEEQRTVISFLDRETAKIDALIAKKEQLVELLQEKRSALITRAVTKGLDPNVPMKDSGVDWLGKFPANWEVKRLRYVSPSLGVGVVVNPSNYVADEGLPFLYGSDISEGRVHSGECRRISLEDSKRLPKSQLHSGDLVMVRVGAPGITAVIPAELEGANCASLLVIRHSTDWVSAWLCYALNAQYVRSQIELVQYGAAQEQFNVSHAANFVLLVPSAPEQTRIVDFLDRETARIDALAAMVRDAIERLKEFRTALISAAVTGKIDVRKEVA